MTTEASDIKGKLIAVIERAEADQAALVARLSDAEKAAIGEPDHWTVKDEIAHVNFWRDRALGRLIALRDGAAAPEPLNEEDDVVNGRNFAQHQRTPWSEVIGEADRLFREAKQVIRDLPDARLTEPHPGAPDGKITRADRFVSDFMDHPAGHLAQIYRERGDTARAEEQERATVELLRELSGQRWAAYGYALYNLGCFYARRGETEKAIAAVGEALGVVPQLAEWSREDPDLDGLRDLSAFEALYR